MIINNVIKIEMVNFLNCLLISRRIQETTINTNDTTNNISNTVSMNDGFFANIYIDDMIKKRAIKMGNAHHIINMSRFIIVVLESVRIMMCLNNFFKLLVKE